MLSKEQAQTIARLLRQGKLSKREISRRVGCHHETVAKVGRLGWRYCLRVTRPGGPCGKRAEWTAGPQVAIHRCRECGGLITTQRCELCHVRMVARLRKLKV